MLTLLPLLYMLFIWLQSSYFNPESLYTLSEHINIYILVTAGILFELAHFFQFGLLYLFVIITVLVYRPLSQKHEKLIFALAVSCGLLDEIHQIFVPFRSFSLWDFGKNVIGILIISYIVHRSYFVKRDSPLGQRLRNMTNSLH